MSYGPSINEMYGRTAGLRDRILKGAKPATCRSSADEVRARHQPQDGQGARSHDSAVVAGACG